MPQLKKDKDRIDKQIKEIETYLNDKSQTMAD